MYDLCWKRRQSGHWPVLRSDHQLESQMVDNTCTNDGNNLFDLFQPSPSSFYVADDNIEVVSTEVTMSVSTNQSLRGPEAVAEFLAKLGASDVKDLVCRHVVNMTSTSGNETLALISVPAPRGYVGETFFIVIALGVIYVIHLYSARLSRKEERAARKEERAARKEEAAAERAARKEEADRAERKEDADRAARKEEADADRAARKEEADADRAARKEEADRAERMEAAGRAARKEEAAGGRAHALSMMEKLSLKESGKEQAEKEFIDGVLDKLLQKDSGVPASVIETLIKSRGNGGITVLDDDGSVPKSVGSNSTSVGSD